jgi:DNA-binding response OmpR family regulator
MTEAPVVHVVEDDDSSRKATARVLRTAGHAAEVYGSADEFLERMPLGPGCLVLDLKLPGSSGLELQERLRKSPNPLPVATLSVGDVPDGAGGMTARSTFTKPGSASTPSMRSRALVRTRMTRPSRPAELAPLRISMPRSAKRSSGHQRTAQQADCLRFRHHEHTIKVHRRARRSRGGIPRDPARIASDLGISPIGKAR